jgi:hypothetical protein
VQQTPGRLDAASTKQFGGALGIDRPAEIITLPVFAIGGDEKPCLRLGFHSFRETFDAELVREPYGGAHHRGVGARDQYRSSL